MESVEALAPTKNKQVGCEGNFCGYLPNQAAYVVLDIIENFIYEKWLGFYEWWSGCGRRH